MNEIASLKMRTIFPPYIVLFYSPIFIYKYSREGDSLEMYTRTLTSLAKTQEMRKIGIAMNY